MAKDWFRNKTWNEEIAAAFDAKLNRARDKQQYLRIQAVEIQSYDPRIALSLLDRFFSIDDESSIDVAMAWLQRAECYAQLGDADNAIRSAFEAVEWEKKFGQIKTQVSVWLPLYIAEQNRTELFDAALDLLSERRNIFPRESFRHFAVLALIAKSCKSTEAGTWASKALDAASSTHSGFSRHPHVGLVGQADRDLMEKMKVIASR